MPSHHIAPVRHTTDQLSAAIPRFNHAALRLRYATSSPPGAPGRLQAPGSGPYGRMSLQRADSTDSDSNITDEWQSALAHDPIEDVDPDARSSHEPPRSAATARRCGCLICLAAVAYALVASTPYRDRIDHYLPAAPSLPPCGPRSQQRRPNGMAHGPTAQRPSQSSCNRLVQDASAAFHAILSWMGGKLGALGTGTVVCGLLAQGALGHVGQRICACLLDSTTAQRCLRFCQLFTRTVDDANLAADAADQLARPLLHSAHADHPGVADTAATSAPTTPRSPASTTVPPPSEGPPTAASSHVGAPTDLPDLVVQPSPRPISDDEGTDPHTRRLAEAREHEEDDNSDTQPPRQRARHQPPDAPQASSGPGDGAPSLWRPTRNTQHSIQRDTAVPPTPPHLLTLINRTGFAVDDRATTPQDIADALKLTGHHTYDYDPTLLALEPWTEIMGRPPDRITWVLEDSGGPSGDTVFPHLTWDLRAPSTPNPTIFWHGTRGD